MPLDPSDTPQFYVQELHDALREQSGRIGPFEIPEEVSGGASAEATLLEGLTITILLSLRGYTVRPTTSERVPINASYILDGRQYSSLRNPG
jgi:hypothetical protein